MTKERGVMVTIVHVREYEQEGANGEVTTICGDDERWYALPGASLEETLNKLKGLGFERRLPHPTSLRR